MKRLSVALPVLAVAFVAVSQAFPQTLRLLAPIVHIPYLAEIEFVRYAEDGKTISERYYSVAYSRKGTEAMLSTTVPGHPIQTAVRRVLDVVGFFLQHVPDTSGAPSCVDNPGTVLGNQVILNHQTVAVDLPLAQANKRLTGWFAPDLGCFALKLRMEQRLPDGTYRLESERRTLRVQTASAQ